MEIYCGDDSQIFIRRGVIAKAGDVVPSHDHLFDHVTYLPRGAAKFSRLTGPGGVAVREIVKRAVEGSNWILIKAGVHHLITALEDDTEYHCIYSYRTEQGTWVGKRIDGWEGALG